jgi:hypothetical protein
MKIAEESGGESGGESHSTLIQGESAQANWASTPIFHHIPTIPAGISDCEAGQRQFTAIVLTAR